jgi:hypothetical protein
MKIRKVILAAAALLVDLPLTVALIAWINLRDGSRGTIVSSGEEREYLLHVPATHDRAVAAPLVISLQALPPTPGVRPGSVGTWRQAETPFPPARTDRRSPWTSAPSS